ncbi:hypothetical protein [Staphylococcus kloosii]|uniref:Uncharacterized protein n=1 Tax=Staphylococcus kloosii TaxID=29384 RepID=A0ABQ0XMX5_9STAP|nr:hypothetical protein [Staphylococcus kloosii]AVQ35780.1 hypothetical protein C7J89_06430 [Staphylococcus kloosii]PNZ05446.1 hypothetical protein CD136_07265 [Staphylococcus kloosii]GEP82539.1 hypothetical protein SKL01_17170 [Staphylococcus kloosii]SUM48842.1 PVL orf 52-like protein [Staphylococcus kloosii]
MKIKQQKTMTMKEYLHYVIDNTELSDISRYYSYNSDGEHGDVEIKLYDLDNKTDTVLKEFTEDKELMVVVSEETDVTESTVLPKLLIILKSNQLIFQDDNGKQRAFTYKSTSIKSMLYKAQSQKDNVDTIHIVNDDGTHTLIWTHDKGLVE